MISLHLKRRFDVILCLFSAIAYMRTYGRLRRALRSFADHLKPGGVMIIEPFLPPEALTSGRVHRLDASTPDMTLTRFDVGTVRGPAVTLDFHFLIGKHGQVTYHRDSHHIGSFRTERVLSLMTDLGLNARFLKKGLMPGRGLFIGTRQFS